MAEYAAAAAAAAAGAVVAPVVSAVDTVAARVALDIGDAEHDLGVLVAVVMSPAGVVAF